MEIIILLAIAVAAGGVYYFNRGKTLDVNNDGKVDTKDVVAAVKNTLDGVKKAADVNKDGKVDIKDVKAAAAAVGSSAAVASVKTAATKATKKAVSTAKKATSGARRGRKPKSK